jgi:hypothetical protein
MIINGNALDVMKRLPSNYVHCGITSSPYYGLRCYGTEPIIWGGDPTCQHDWSEVHPQGYRGSDTNPGPLQHEGNKNREKLTSSFCSKCGAWRGELGLEPTPELFIDHLTLIYHEFFRVLRQDGVFFANIGDSYVSKPGKGGSGTPTDKNNRGENYQRPQGMGDFKEKDLMEIPSMLAASLRKDGWYLRARLPWLKRNSLPSSVRDRPSSSIEYVFVLTKSGNTEFWTHPFKNGLRTKPEPDYIFKNMFTRKLEFDAPDNWKELLFIDEKGEERKLWKRKNLWEGHDYFYDYVATMQPSSESYNKDKRPRGVLRQCVNPNGKYPDEGQFKKQDHTGNVTTVGFNARYEPNEFGLRFMRDSDFFFKTWQGLLHNEDGMPMALIVNPKGYKGAHFACFPPHLVEPLIAAATSDHGVCPKCGAPWHRTTILKHVGDNRGVRGDNHRGGTGQNDNNYLALPPGDAHYEAETTGWLPTCSCGCTEVEPAIVLDMFGGSGSTGVAAEAHGRKCVLIDLNPDYCTLAEKRLKEGK